MKLSGLSAPVVNCTSSGLVNPSWFRVVVIVRAPASISQGTNTRSPLANDIPKESWMVIVDGSVTVKVAGRFQAEACVDPRRWGDGRDGDLRAREHGPRRERDRKFDPVLVLDRDRPARGRDGPAGGCLIIGWGSGRVVGARQRCHQARK